MRQGNCLTGMSARRSDDDSDDFVAMLKALKRTGNNIQRTYAKWKENFKDLGLEETTADVTILSSCGAASMAADPHRIVSSQKKTEHKRMFSDSNECDYDDTKDYNVLDCNGGVLCEDVELFDWRHPDDTYFEVTTADEEEIERAADSEASFESLLIRLQETKEALHAKHCDVNSAVADVEKAVEDSRDLRERISMTYLSLTSLERNQEKIMREAIFENMNSNNRIRELQDELIQLRIRDTQHQSDIHRLMAENSRLKLKLTEVRTRAPWVATFDDTSTALEVLPTPEPEPPTSYPASSGLQGLLDVEELCRPAPFSDGVIQRATMRSITAKTLSMLPGIVVHENTAREQKRRCPLCNQRRDDDEDDSVPDTQARDRPTRSVATCTGDMQSTAALRKNVCVMGIYLPVPPFVAYVLRALDESMATIGRVCFAEMPPFDPSFPELEIDFVNALKLMHSKFQQFYRCTQD